MIAPLATDWAERERLFWVNTLVRVEKIRTPKPVPTIVPRPPMRSVPPTPTAGSSTHGPLYELEAIAAVVVGGTLLIGGRGTIVGTVFGVLIFSTLTNVFTQNNLSISAQSVARGAIIVAAVLLQQRFAARHRST